MALYCMSLGPAATCPRMQEKKVHSTPDIFFPQHPTPGRTSPATTASTPSRSTMWQKGDFSSTRPTPSPCGAAAAGWRWGDRGRVYFPCSLSHPAAQSSTEQRLLQTYKVQGPAYQPSQQTHALAPRSRTTQQENKGCVCGSRERAGAGCPRCTARAWPPAAPGRWPRRARGGGRAPRGARRTIPGQGGAWRGGGAREEVAQDTERVCEPELRGFCSQL